MKISIVKKEIFRQVLLRLLHTGVESIDAEAFWNRCQNVAKETNINFPWLEFYDLLSISKCFLVSDGTQGTVSLPRPLREWNEAFIKG